MPPPDAPIPGDAPGETPSAATGGSDPSDPKRRLIIGAAALAVVVSAIATFAVVANNNDDDKASDKTTTSSRSSNGSSSTSGSQSTAAGGTTTTRFGVTSSTVPGSTGPQPTDAITKLPIGTTTSSTPNGVTTTPTTGNGPSDDQLDAAYLEAYLAECTKIWGHSSNGLLYDPDDPQDSYTITTCTESADAAFRTSSNTIAAAKKLGVEDAIWFSSLNTSSGQMCWLDTANDTLLACWDPENPDVPTTPTTS